MSWPVPDAMKIMDLMRRLAKSDTKVGTLIGFQSMGYILAKGFHYKDQAHSHAHGQMTPALSSNTALLNKVSWGQTFLKIKGLPHGKG